MKRSELKNRQVETLSQAIIDGWSPKKEKEFEKEQNEIKNIKVRELAEKVYLSYLPKGEEIAKERKELYLKNNLK